MFRATLFRKTTEGTCTNRFRFHGCAVLTRLESDSTRRSRDFSKPSVEREEEKVIARRRVKDREGERERGKKGEELAGEVRAGGQSSNICQDPTTVWR